MLIEDEAQMRTLKSSAFSQELCEQRFTRLDSSECGPTADARPPLAAARF